MPKVPKKTNKLTKAKNKATVKDVKLTTSIKKKEAKVTVKAKKAKLSATKKQQNREYKLKLEQAKAAKLQAKGDKDVKMAAVLGATSTATAAVMPEQQFIHNAQLASPDRDSIPKSEDDNINTDDHLTGLPGVK